MSPPDRSAMAAPRLPEPGPFRIIDDEGALVGPPPSIERTLLRKIYREMSRLRILDERMMILQRQGRIGFYGAATGQEAAPIGAAAALSPDDWIFPALREGAVMLYRGYDLETYVAQVFGNDRDVLRGRQMPSHYADRRVNQVSWSSCIGNQAPQAVGAAWAAKLRNDGRVVATFLGDGATSEGDFHYALNFAAVYRVPAVLICQNNHWSISVPTAKQTASRTIAEKALAYGLPYALVDGNDVLAVHAAVREAADRARAGEGASFLELLTYRIGAHSSSDDPRVYRDQREVEQWKQRDPLERYRKFLLAAGHLGQAEVAAERSDLEREVLTAVQRAEIHPAPSVETMFDDVYSELPWHLREQRLTMLEEQADPPLNGDP